MSKLLTIGPGAIRLPKAIVTSPPSHTSFIGRKCLSHGSASASPALKAKRHGIVGGHHIGTTRMSAVSGEGVVDPDCRVHGVSNLHIASASVFPTSGQANPTLTLLALVFRLADHLGRSSNT